MLPTRLAVSSCLVCFVLFVVFSAASPKEGDIRLANANSQDKWQGRVEIFHNKTWGTICDDTVGLPFANVVCRQLGYKVALAVYPESDFGPGTGPIHLDRVRCTGNESKISDCNPSGWNNGYCDHTEDVGVACLHKSATPPGGCTFDDDWCGYTNASGDFNWRSNSHKTASSNTGPEHDHTTGNGSYLYMETSYPRKQGDIARVVSPAFTNARCIEFYYIMKGKHVNELSVYIDDGQDQTVVWQKKGETRIWSKATFPVTKVGSVQIVFEGLVGVSYQGDIAIDDVTPKKTPCPLLPSDAKPDIPDLKNITSTIRLVNGNVSSAGRIEVLHNGRWGTVCGTHFHLPAAKVMCKELGYLDVETLVPCCLFGPGNGMVWLDNLHCEGREASLKMCPHKGWGMTRCPHSQDVGVICKTKTTLKQIRLAGSDNDFEGRVEVKIGGIWGTIMDYGWDIFDATVFCRQMNYGGASSVYSRAHYGQGKGPIWFSTVLCQGNETELWQCNMTQHQIQWKPHWWWHWSLHRNDASVECYDLRLVSVKGKPKSEGRLEMRYLGTWGTVCNEGWNMNAAKVACRNLGYSKVKAMKVNYTIKTTDKVNPIVSRFRCSGAESALGLCSYDPLLSVKHGCKHADDVTIACDAPIVKPTSTPGQKDCKTNCPSGSCYKNIKHKGVCICRSMGDAIDPLCDATDGMQVSEAMFPKLTLETWNPDTFKANLRDQLNAYCSAVKTCKTLVNGTKFDLQDIMIIDGWPNPFQGKLNLKFVVLMPMQNSRDIFPRNVIITMTQKQNKLAGYDVVMTRQPIRPTQQPQTGANNTVRVVVPIVVILVIVGIAVVVYIVYKKRSAFGSSSGPSSQRYLHLSPDDRNDQDDPLLTMEDDPAPMTVTA